MWYQTIADRAYSIVYGKAAQTPATYDWFLKRVSTDIYRAVLLLNYVLVTSLVTALYHLNVLFPSFINFGVYAILFPMYIIMANQSHPLPRSEELKRSNRDSGSSISANAEHLSKASQSLPQQYE
ncbi:hypothetical protein BCR33DRAFT_783421 [Rhizoclosmatium globosum]|uniref:Uncharacterized protein n=1 Tax=Rhizoclosmatium globosum TaxID=329046 RepID=A0A1Y2CJF3_9FUNG|nr:hypothetical protein BCR33DRAFT_783421 [Rhizoclosmatium globosum]|eukprot:ORY46984.1 hypothetical protein BCR33DRAFT_783421 [Rhizoclosmatium globosum]